MTVLFETRNLTRAFFGIKAVDRVSIDVTAGSIMGLIGQNGAGKSTLMNLIGGVIQPNSGEMFFHGKPHMPHNPAEAQEAGIAFIHQELNLFTNLSIAENIFVGKFPTKGWGPFQFVNRKLLHIQTQDILKTVGLDVDPNTLIEEMSPGERQLVEIAKALYFDASLIIFDEPTTSLTNRETERLFKIMAQLKEQGKAVIFISHILKDVLAISDSIAVMRDGVLMAQESVEKYDINRMISLMVGRQLEQLYPTKTAQPTSNPLLDVKEVSAKGIVKDITFQLHQGEVLGFFGLMGSGRTELARILFGLDEFDQGEMSVGKHSLRKQTVKSRIKNNMAFVTENRREEGLLMNISITDNISLVSLHEFAKTLLNIIDQQQLEETSLRAAHALQLKSGNIHTQTTKALSGGNQQKVVIAKWLLAEPRVFIMDEPTRGVDVGAKYEIYSIIDNLAALGSGVLMISSELEELIGMCDRILVMNQGEIVGEFMPDQFNEEAILRTAFREQEGEAHEAIS